MPGDAPSSLLRRALRAGADGIVLEAELHAALVASVRAVAAGQLAVPLALRRQLAPRHLSYREKQVLSLVAVGYTNRQIADTLYLSESTVKTHLSSAFGKLDARSRAEAAARVLDPDEGLSLTIAPLVAENLRVRRLAVPGRLPSAPSTTRRRTSSAPPGPSPRRSAVRTAG